jgi:hypothetical protein
MAAPTQWRMLAILSALMGSGSISTDFYLPAMLRTIVLGRRQRSTWV